MKIRIYQINLKRDTNNVAFMNWDFLEKVKGSQAVDSKIYDKVFDGEVDCKTLEDVYRMFNLNHPKDYKGRSLSVSDVVEVIKDEETSDFNFCDSIGCKQIGFAPEETREFKEKEQ